MGFHINKKIAAKNSTTTKNAGAQGNSKFMPKANTKSAGAAKKPVKTGGTRGS